MQNDSEPEGRPGASPPGRLPPPLAATYRTAKRLFIFLVGGTLAITGALFLFSPMPGAAAVLVVGLGILGLEFEFARRWLIAFREKSAAAAERFRARRNSQGDSSGRPRK